MAKSKLQFGHGSVAVETEFAAAGDAPAPVLQFGHGSVAVETETLKNRATSVTRLQFGHGSVAVETPGPPPAAGPCPAGFNSATARSPWRQLDRLGLVEHDGASIRPRLGRRGDAGPLAVAVQLGLGASIRPRLGRRGDGYAPRLTVSTSIRFNSATARSPWRLETGRLKVDRQGCPLQFGHGSVAVETTSGATSTTSGPGSFNSATARSPWRLLPVQRLQHRDREASIRPRLGRRGDPSAPPAGRTTAAGFNSATARSPWRRVKGAFGAAREWVLQFGHGSVAVETSGFHDPRVLHDGCFNSATARSPWRPPSGCGSPTGSNWLQFGHGSVAVETTPFRGPPVPTRRASIRPRLGRRGDPTPGGILRVLRAAASIRPRLGRRGDERPLLVLLLDVDASIRPRLGRRGDR